MKNADFMGEIRRAVSAKDVAERMGMTISRSGSEYVTYCPWHSDTHPSLTFYDDKGVGRCKCFACGNGGSSIDLVAQVEGCSAIEAAKKIAETFALHVDIPERKGGGKPREKIEKPAELPGLTVHTVKPEQEAKPKRVEVVDYDHPVAFYDYRDAEGKTVFQVVRLRKTVDGKPDKTFRQRHYDPASKSQKKRRDGWVYEVSDEQYDAAPIYRMPETLAAIRDGKTIYIVEGEKDVETMTRLGYAATTNARGAGKWIESGLKLMAGARVVILPDNDPPTKNERTGEISWIGQEGAWKVATSLKPIAASVRVVNLAAAWEDMPPKGDISDMAEALGDERTRQLLARQIRLTPIFQPDAVRFWLPPDARCREYIRKAGAKYDLTDEGMAYYTGEMYKPISNFFMIPVEQRTLDDGITQEMSFTLDAWNRPSGRKLKRVTIKNAEFDSMAWVTRAWGFDANIMPGTQNRDKMRWITKEIGRISARTVLEYSHSGWRRIGGRWAYLYHGGAIGADGVTVNLGDGQNISRYSLEPPPKEAQISLKDACKESHAFLSLAPIEVTAPLLGTMYLAPLREWLYQARMQPSFVLYLEAMSGSKKSTITALALSHFGDFNDQSLPASFSDTSNAVEVMGFALKDMPLVVDNYHPSADQRTRRQQEALLQRLALIFGDGAGRQRMDVDGKLRRTNPPRSLCIVTAEQSGLAHDPGGMARFFTVTMDRSGVFDQDDPHDERRQRLTEAQRKARAGWLRQAMRGYIEWLIPQADALPEQLYQRFEFYRDYAMRQPLGHSRAPKAVAHLCVGLEYMLKYFAHTGALTQEEAAQEMNRMIAALLRSSAAQAEAIREESPANIFIGALRSLITTMHATTKDISKGAAGAVTPKDSIGWRDEEFYYLDPGMARNAVDRFCRDSGADFTATKQALYSSMRAEGYLGDEPTQSRYIDGASKRVIVLPRSLIDGRSERESFTQLSMEDAGDIPW